MIGSTAKSVRVRPLAPPILQSKSRASSVWPGETLIQRAGCEARKSGSVRGAAGQPAVPTRPGVPPKAKTQAAPESRPDMRSKPVALLLADLSVTKTHSRPYTSNDNPYSESQFRTMKYRPEFPNRFGCIQDSRLSAKPSSPGTTTTIVTLESA